MMLEAAALISADEETVLCWHLPADRTSVLLPDEHGDMWNLIVKHRGEMAGDAHTHPWTGVPHPSWEDVTTYAAMEKWLRRRVKHWVVSMDRMVLVTWQGPNRYDYGVTKIPRDKEPGWAAELRARSRTLEPAMNKDDAAAAAGGES